MQEQQKNKTNFNRTKPHKITNVYKSEYKQGKSMNDNEYKILWTISWFIFISVLSIFFNSRWYLCLLFFWLIGLYGKET